MLLFEIHLTDYVQFQKFHRTNFEKNCMKSIHLVVTLREFITNSGPNGSAFYKYMCAVPANRLSCKPTGQTYRLGQSPLKYALYPAMEIGSSL